jgi:hypothetical protein
MGKLYDPPIIKQSMIEEEKDTYTFVGNDRNILRQMCDEINERITNYQFHSLAQLKLWGPPVGSSDILLKYIHQIESESFRATVFQWIIWEKMHHKVKIKDLDRIIMDLYHHFRASSYYISPPGPARSAHIYIKYDNAFNRLKSRKIVPELVELMKNRREVYILSITASMIARKWAPKELGEIMANHLMNKNVTRADVGIPEEGDYYPSLETIVGQSSFTAIKCLQYYPSEENLKIIMDYTNNPYEELAKFAQEHAEKMKKKLLEM